MPTVSGMKGEGFYDQHSEAQSLALAAVGDWLRQAVADLSLPAAPAPIVVADFGCSEGQNSIQEIGLVVQELRQRTSQPICGIHSDLPGNNFNRLFANLHDATRSNYLQDHGQLRPNTFALAAAGSFYGPILPHGSVHVALSFFAVQWLDHTPKVHVPDFIGYTRNNPQAAAAFREQADRDLTGFLQHRADELVPGGKLLVVVPGAMNGRFCSQGVYDVITDAGQDLVRAGRIDRAAFEEFVFGVYFFAADELVAPVVRPGSALHGRFRVDQSGAWEAPTPFVDRYRRTSDARRYAAEYTAFLRAFSEPVIAPAWCGPQRDPALVAAIFDRIEERLAAEPERYFYHNIQVAMLLTRM